jgi:uncharacterized low-complexity protein
MTAFFLFLSRRTKMSKLGTLTPIAAVLAVSISGVAHAADNPFALKPVTGIVVADAQKEGKCGADKAKEAKCGAAKKEGKCGEGKCGAKAKKEGKCGEGKCGADKAKEGKCGAAAPATPALPAPAK